MDKPSVSCACLTYDRPHLLQRAIDDFLLQDYEGDAELVVFNSHPLQQIEFNHPLVRVVNWRPRPKTLGACRNLCVEHCANQIIIPWDDDDSYRKDHISSIVRDLGDDEVVKINGFWSDTCNGPKAFQKRGPVHQIAYSKRLFRLVGGYPEINTEEDRELYARLLKRTSVREIMRESEDATLTYNNCGFTGHVSWSLDYRAHGKKEPSQRGVIDLSRAFKTGSNPTVNIITNTTNGAGLARHALILKDRFEDNGFRVNLLHFKEPESWVKADLNLFIEVLVARAVDLAPINWFMPMPEWFFADQWMPLLGRMDRVLCNTHDAVRLFSSRHRRVDYMGFESADILRADAPRERAFLHVAGKSLNKNTELVLEAWQRHSLPYRLTLLGSRDDLRYDPSYPSINVIDRVGTDELIRLVNSHMFHICVSKYEGWGHYLHEAHSTGGYTLTHDQPPLNEFHAAIRVPAHVSGTLRLADIVEPDVDALADAVHQMAQVSDGEVRQAGLVARQHFLRNRDEFRERFSQLCATILE